MISTRTTPRLRLLALFVVLTALAAPGARAAQKAVSPDALDRHMINHATKAISPDDRGGIRVSVQSNPSRSPVQTVIPDALERYVMSHTAKAIAPDDRAGIRGSFQSNPTRSPVQTQVVSDSFHWGDAGIGAGSALVLMLLAGGAVTYSARRSRAGVVGF